MQIIKMMLVSAMLLSAPLTADADATKRTAVLATVEGTVEVKPSSPKAVWVAGTASTALAQGDSIRTGRDSYATIHINGGGESINVELKGESQIMIVELTLGATTLRQGPEQAQGEAKSLVKKKSTILSLEIGEVIIKTKNISAESNLEIKTPTSIIASRGGSSSFSIQVERGE